MRPEAGFDPKLSLFWSFVLVCLLAAGRVLLMVGSVASERGVKNKL